MLRELHIQNLALIDELKLEFKSGLNILSGETGAGKSVILNSVSLILGARSDSEMIRTGKDSALVEASFEIKNMTEVSERLEGHGISFDSDDLLVLRRVLTRSGKNKVYINGQLANVAILQEITKGLVDISSQHEFHRLMNPNSHVHILDAYGDLHRDISEYRERLHEMRELIEEVKSLTVNEAERARQIDFLRYQMEEIQAVNPKPLEDQNLEKDIKRLKSAKERADFLALAAQELVEDENCLVGRIAKLLDQCTDMTSLDENFENLRRSLEAASIQLEEAVQELRRLSRMEETSGESLDDLMQRLHEIKTIMRKYGATIEEVLSYREESEEKLKSLEQREVNLESLQAKLEEIRGEALKVGYSLTEKRKKLSKIFKDSVEAELKDLGLENGQFVSVFLPLEDERRFGPDGIEAVHFDVSLNPGEPPKSLAKFASGGELSRVLLAMKNVIAGKGEISVYLFDEVDAGIGGKIAFQVGKKLAQVSQHNQVICITHLPQVACFADRHFHVFKSVEEGRTTTQIKPLKPQDKAQEIIRMIGGEELETSAQHAEELIEAARSLREESAPPPPG